MPDNTNNYVQSIGLDFTQAVKNAQAFDKTLADVSNKLISFQKTIDTVNNKTRTALTFETGTGDIKRIISDLTSGITSITTTTNAMKNAVSGVNALYAQQKSIVTERANLEKRSLSSGENESNVIRKRIDYLNEEYVKIQKKIETEFNGYRNAEKELGIKESQVKYTAQLEQAEARINDRLKERASLQKSSEVNNLYSQQKNIITEVATLQRNALTSGEQESAVIRKRIEYLNQEYIKLQQKVEVEYGSYRNAEKELQLKEHQTKYAFQQEKAEAAVNDQLKQRSNLEKNILDTLVKMATVYVTMKLRQMFNEAIDYAGKYYDLLNEIRIVSGTALNPETGEMEAAMSVEKAEEIGRAYRRMAKEMQVSSVEIATAAVEFWRQGLPEDEVESRLQSTIKYAKISGLEFQASAELITAATNAMEVSAERAADVFAYLGDASAAGKLKLPELIAI